MAGMTYAEKLLTRLLLTTEMNRARAAWIVGSLPTDAEVDRMIHYIVEHQEASPAELYSTALKILRETNPNLLEETKK
jgi:hypothetical protein